MAGVALTFALVLALTGQEPFDAESASRRVTALRPRIWSDDPATKEDAAAELYEIEAQLRETLETAAPGDTSTLRWILYRTLATRAELDPYLGDEERLDTYDAAIAEAELSEHPDAILRARILKVKQLRALERLPEAYALLEQSVDLGAESEVVGPFLCYELAETAWRLGRYDEALRWLDETREHDLTGAKAPLRWRVDGTRGQIYLQMGLPDVAAPAIQSEAEQTRELRAQGLAWSAEIVASRMHTANLALGQGDFEHVVARVDEFLADTELFAANPVWRASLLRTQGEALAELERDDPQRAPRAAAVLAEALGAQMTERDRLRAEVLLADVRITRGELGAAGELLARARGRLEDWRRDQDWTGPLQAEAHMAAVEARLGLASRAPESVLRARFEALRRAFDDQLALWRSFPLRRGGQAFLQYWFRRAWLSELTNLCVALEGEHDGAELALEQWMGAQALGSIVRRSGAGPGSVGDVRERLLSDERGMLVYLPGPRQSHLIVLDRDRARHFALTSERALAGLARAGSGDALARELLPKDARTALEPWTGVTVVGADLFEVPCRFELLPFPVRPLGIRFALDHLPSLPLGLLLERGATDPSREAAHDLVVLAAPSTTRALRERWPELGPIPFTDSDRQRLEAAYDPGRAHTASGAGAGADQLARLFADARVGQLLVHAVQDTGRERPAALVLAARGEHDGLLGCDAVEELGAVPPLVILTACESGRGPARRGDEGTGNMAGAWLTAGAQAVVLSEAELDYRTATDLSAAAHALLAAGRPPAEAFRAARERVADASGVEGLARGGRVRVVGLGHLPLFPATRSPAPAPASGRRTGWLVAACCAVLLAAGAWAMARRLSEQSPPSP